MAILAYGTAGAARAEDFRLIRSLSGPSGKVAGSTFAFDEVRSRFVHPQDKSLVAYFEWEAPVGTRIVTALWKRPDGRVDSISPDVKIESKTSQLSCYWTYVLYPEMMPGVWVAEVRIDGRPAGSHSFEIAGTSPQTATGTGDAAQPAPALDQVYRAASASLVWVRKFDAAGRLTDTALGFVAGKDRVVTALQVVDGASKLEIEFAGGRKAGTEQLANWSRAGDWAVVVADTGSAPALERGEPERVAVGERLIVFAVEGDAKAIGGVDISGKRVVQGFGERIQFSPPIAIEAAGGPLLDLRGKVVGIVGGSVMPGARFDGHHMSVSPALGMAAKTLTAATPMFAMAGQTPAKVSALSELVAAGVLTAPLSDMDGLVYVTTSLEMNKGASDPLPREVSEFTRRDKQVWVTSEWQKKGKVSKGFLSAKVYDDQNRVRVNVEPKKMSLPSTLMRSSFGFSPGPLEAGVYRVDLMWDDRPVWRTFVRVTN